jgi:hypothetical protein
MCRVIRDCGDEFEPAVAMTIFLHDRRQVVVVVEWALERPCTISLDKCRLHENLGITSPRQLLACDILVHCDNSKIKYRSNNE